LLTPDVCAKSVHGLKEEGMTAIAFEQADLVADRRRCDAEFGCGSLEAHVPRGGLKGP
jgi:hypothetical protein